jgi:hypothetical protein
MKTLPYGVRRVSQIAAKTEAARQAMMFTLSGVGALAPRCIRCEAPARFFLCDATGLPLEPQQGGFCRKCAPTQPTDDITPSLGAPAALETVEDAAREYDARSDLHWRHVLELRTERDDLARELATMLAFVGHSPYASNGPTNKEINATGARLVELDEMLILDDERPFILGFDDLPASYFSAA